jgi:hypothetical protein
METKESRSVAVGVGKMEGITAAADDPAAGGGAVALEVIALGGRDEIGEEPLASNAEAAL